MTIINDSYKQQLQELHKNPKLFDAGAKKVGKVENFINKYTPSSLIDFGCGKGNLIKGIAEIYPNITVKGYDPGVPEFEELPSDTFDVLISTDALEHVEPEMLDQTLQIINKLFSKSAYLVIASYPAKKTLPDGRNAHLIIESLEWWEDKIKKYIDGTIVQVKNKEINAQPKKGPSIHGQEFVFIIEK